MNFPIIQINKNNNDNISVSEESSFNYDENDAQKADQTMQEIIAKETDVDSQL